MKLSIIITHYHTPELLRECLSSMQKNLKTFDCEISVADSATEKETKEMVGREFPQAKFFENSRNIGYGKLVNQGLKETRGEYIFICNADIIAKEGVIEALVDYLEKNPEVGIAGPKLKNPDGTVQPSFFRFYSPLTLLYRRTILGKTPWGKKDLHRFLYEDLAWPIEKPIFVDWLMGSALMAKKEAVQKVGLLDERYFMYFEDVDWCRRFWEAGFKVVYFPQAEVIHKHLRASKKKGGILDLFLNKYTRIHFSSALKYFLKFGVQTPTYGAPLRRLNKFSR